MEFTNLIRQRQSVRRYSDKPVEPEKLRQCLEAARMAPSASNAQPWSFVVAEERELANAVAHATFDKYLSFNKFVPQAPLLIAFVIEKAPLKTRLGSWIKDRDFSMTDHGIAAAHFCLMATELGLGTCMLGWFNERKVKQLLQIPAKKRISMLISVGYPEQDYPLRIKIRKPFESNVFYHQYKG
jgi:nitroreductase